MRSNTRTLRPQQEDFNEKFKLLHMISIRSEGLDGGVGSGGRIGAVGALGNTVCLLIEPRQPQDSRPSGPVANHHNNNNDCCYRRCRHRCCCYYRAISSGVFEKWIKHKSVCRHMARTPRAQGSMVISGFLVFRMYVFYFLFLNKISNVVKFACLELIN